MYTAPCIALVVLVALLNFAHGEVQLPRWFSDSMVLQTGNTTFLTGITFPPSEQVTITGDVGSYSLISEPSGHWKVRLVPSDQWQNKDGMTITVRGATGAPRVATNVLAGDVFFCSGQSKYVTDCWQLLGSCWAHDIVVFELTLSQHAFLSASGPELHR